jgi:GH24 family phage-related lysozyme (muramidase)
VKLSRGGKLVLAQVEACVLVPYKDGRHYSIGFGHNGPEVEAMGQITVAQAFELLAEDLKPREERVFSLLKPVVSQHKFDGFVLLHYQSGNRYLPAFAHLQNYGQEEFLEAIWPMAAYPAGDQEGDREGEFSEGLETRRKREMFIVFDGDYGDIRASIKLYRDNPRKTQPVPYRVTAKDLAFG